MNERIEKSYSAIGFIVMKTTIEHEKPGTGFFDWAEFGIRMVIVKYSGTLMYYQSV